MPSAATLAPRLQAALAQPTDSPRLASGEAREVPELAARARATRRRERPAARAELAVHLLFDRRQARGLDLATLRLGIDAVDLRGVQTKDLALDLGGELRIR